MYIFTFYSSTNLVQAIIHTTDFLGLLASFDGFLVLKGSSSVAGVHNTKHVYVTPVNCS